MKRTELEAEGFVGWISLISAFGNSLLPRMPGVYAVSYEADRPSAWPAKSCGGRHKGRDPTQSSMRLAKEWVENAEIVYIGKTDRTLAKRIGEFARFGNGEPVAHWGGRLIWQLTDVNRLMIGWRALDPGLATLGEAQLFERFTEGYGRLPFANLRK